MHVDVPRTFHWTDRLKSAIMFKLFTLSCLLAVGVQCKSVQNPVVPYSPQPYSPQPYTPQPYSAQPYSAQPYSAQPYPSSYPQVYGVQPKYNVQPSYVAPASYSPASYRQYLVPANPAYNPYYYGYAPYPAYPQPYPSYGYAPNDENEAPPSAAAQPGWGEYLSSNFWNYVPNFPALSGSESQQPAEAESGSSSSAAESSSTAEASPGKGDKPAEATKIEKKPASGEQPAQSPTKQFAPSPFVYFGQPQFYGQFPYQQAAYDPSKLNAANNGAVSSFLFYRNQPQPQPAVFQQPQPVVNQKYYQASVPQFNQDTASVAYHRYLQYQKQQQGQYLQQPQQSFQQPQQSFQQPQQSFQQQQESFQQQQESFQQKPQQDESSVVVDSNASEVQVDADGQQKAQSKLSTGPTVAVAQPQGIAFAGIGGRAGAGPIGTAIVGKNATAISGPKATAISLDLTPTIDLEPVHKMTTAYVAKYSPELGVYRVAEIKTFDH